MVGPSGSAAATYAFGMLRFDSATSRATWRQLRALRARPPGVAGLAERRETFGAALEQCEQLFEAAATVGYEARPLPLFYALSQGGRALAAAVALDNWLLRGHGIGATKLSGSTWDIELANQKQGAFTRVADLLKSPSLPVATRLGDLCETLPEVVRVMPASAGGEPALRIVRELYRGAETFGGPVVDATSIAVAGAMVYGLRREYGALPLSEQRSALQSDLVRYPTMRGFEVPGADDRPVAIGFDDAGDKGIRLMWQADGGFEYHRQERIARMCLPRADGSLWIAPAVAGNDEPLHPLVTWWAVLFATSMLARYEPASWLRALRIDQNDDAVALESLLDEAMMAVPQLLLDVMRPA